MSKILFSIFRTIMVIASIVAFGLFVAPMAGGIINIGNLAGALLSAWVFCVSLKPLHKSIRKFCKKHLFTRFVYRFVNVCFIMFAIYGTLITGAMTYFAVQQPAENSTAIVLGAQVKPWGPSVMLQGRIDGAEKFLSANPDSKAVLSGGQGDDEPMSEAQSMFECMTNDGFEESKLYLEDKSTNTTENIRNSLEIIKNNNLNSDLAIVTDGFHQLRTRIIAHQLGLENNIGSVNSETSIIYLPTFAVREWFAIPNQIFFR